MLVAGITWLMYFHMNQKISATSVVCLSVYLSRHDGEYLSPTLPKWLCLKKSTETALNLPKEDRTQITKQFNVLTLNVFVKNN